MPDTKETGRSGNDIVDTVLFSANGTFDNQGTISLADDTVTTWASSSQMNVYTLSAADAGAGVEADVLSDYGRSGPLNPIDFDWNDEVSATLEQLNSIQSDMNFERVTTYSSDVDVTMSATSGSGFFPLNPRTGTHTIEGQGVFPGTAQNSAGEDVTHLVVNGNPLIQTAGSAEVGAGHYRNWITTHEFGHDLSLSHPFSAFDRAGNPISAFPQGFDIDNEKYTVMSYSSATPRSRDSAGNIEGVTYGHSIGYMAVDVAAIQHANGIGDNNTGNTKYNLTDGAQITGTGSNNAALDLNGVKESQDLIETARADAEQAARDSWTPEDMTEIVEGLREHGSPMPHAQFWQEATRLKEQSFENAGETAAVAETARQQADGTYMSGEESIGRAYKTIYDGQREVDAAGKESVGNGGTDEISYDGSEQSVMINLNDAGLGADQTDAQYLDQQREIKGSDRFQNDFNAELQNEIDATVNDTSGNLRLDAYSAGGHFSKTYTTDAAGKVTATQDGGYSIANGVVIENATGGEKADTLIGNEHDNVLTGNAGDDAMFGGHGNDTLNGGVGNDTLVAGRGNNKLDGGADMDAASYTDYYDPAVDPTNTTGVSFSITGNQATITKPLNGAVAGPASASVETDKAVNVEHFEGTARDDVFTVENLSGNMYIDGGAGQDTLTVKDPAGAFKLDMTGGTYPAGHPRAGDAYEGTVSDGTHTVYLEDKNLTVNIETAAPPAPTKKAEISLEDAIHTLTKDQSTLNRQVQETGVSTPAYEAVNHPDAAAMFANLHANGVSSLKTELTPEMGAEERVGHLILAGRDATQAAGIPMPYERDSEEAQTETIAEQSYRATEAPYESEPVHEEEYSYSL